MLEPTFEELGRARRFAVEAAHGSGFSEDRAFDISVAVSEATANAIEHVPVKGQVTVRSLLYPDRLEFQVVGPGEFQTPHRLQNGRSHRGLGLPLMAQFSDHLALYSGPAGGTMVSLTFYRPGSVRTALEALPPSYQELVEENELVSAIAAKATVGLHVLDPDMRFKWANPAYRSFLDEPYRSGDLTGLAIGEVLPALADAERLADVLEVSRTGVASGPVECRLPLPQGGWAWFRKNVVPLTAGSAGPPYDVLVILSDETVRMQAEEERGRVLKALRDEQRRADKVVRESEEKCRGVLDSLDKGFCIIEMVLDEGGDATDWRYLEVNQGFHRWSGLTGDVTGRLISELLPEMEKSWLRFYGEVARTGAPGHLRARVESLNAWYEVNAFRLGGEESRLVAAVFSDVTENVLSQSRLLFVAEVDRMLSGSLAAADIVPLVGAKLGEHLHVSNFVFAEADQENDRARVLHAWRRERAVDLLGTYKLSELNGPDYWRAMHDAVPYVVDNTLVDLRTDGARHIEFGVGAYIVVPFYREGRWKYLVSVDSERARPWTATEVELVQEVANRVVARVERAQAEEELRASEESFRTLAEENERLYRQQLEIAENLQLTLLHVPSQVGRLKVGHLYRSATEAAKVGGDFYDVFEAKDGTIAILIGDVAGHGVQAARTGTMVKDVVHAFTHQSVRTNEVLRRTNELLMEKDMSGFVSLFLAILDPQGGALRYSSAGHPEALLKRVSGEIVRLGCGTAPLGVYPDASWKPQEARMGPGDILLLYTDGVIEARRNGELFGDERLERLLRRKRIAVGRLPRTILDRVLAFSGGQLHDDFAVLAVALPTSAEGAGAQPGPASGGQSPPAQQTLLDL